RKRGSADRGVQEPARMKRAARLLARGVLILLASGFAAIAYIYLTVPDVRPLRTENPSSTAFMRLRAGQAEAQGKTLATEQRWVPYSRISPNLKKAVIV